MGVRTVFFRGEGFFRSERVKKEVLGVLGRPTRGREKKKKNGNPVAEDDPAQQRNRGPAPCTQESEEIDICGLTAKEGGERRHRSFLAQGGGGRHATFPPLNWREGRGRGGKQLFHTYMKRSKNGREEFPEGGRGKRDIAMRLAQKVRRGLYLHCCSGRLAWSVLLARPVYADRGRGKKKTVVIRCPTGVWK